MRAENGGTPAAVTSRMAAVASNDVSVPASHVRSALAHACATTRIVGDELLSGRRLHAREPRNRHRRAQCGHVMRSGAAVPSAGAVAALLARSRPDRRNSARQPLSRRASTTRSTPRPPAQARARRASATSSGAFVVSASEAVELRGARLLPVRAANVRRTARRRCVPINRSTTSASTGTVPMSASTQSGSACGGQRHQQRVVSGASLAELAGRRETTEIRRIADEVRAQVGRRRHRAAHPAATCQERNRPRGRDDRPARRRRTRPPPPAPARRASVASSAVSVMNSTKRSAPASRRDRCRSSPSVSAAARSVSTTARARSDQGSASSATELSAPWRRIASKPRCLPALGRLPQRIKPIVDAVAFEPLRTAARQGVEQGAPDRRRILNDSAQVRSALWVQAVQAGVEHLDLQPNRTRARSSSWERRWRYHCGCALCANKSPRRGRFSSPARMSLFTIN